jgi:hypothetical protein
VPWFESLWNFLSPLGYEAYCLDGKIGRGAAVPRYAVATGQSPRYAGVGHAVVWEFGVGMVHDPHPSRAGIVGEPQTFLGIVPSSDCGTATVMTEARGGW